MIRSISSQGIIGEVIRDFRIKNTDWLGDAVDWIGEAVRAIGYHTGFEKKSKICQVKGHVVEIPYDFEKLLELYYNGLKLHIGGDTTGFSLADNTTEFPVGGINYYTTNFDKIAVSFEQGEVTMFYTAFPLDCDGFPMVVDTYKYKEALKWYLVKNFLAQGNKHPVFSYQDAEQRFERFKDKAANEAKMPSIDKLERFTNMWTRIKFNPHLGSDSFKQGELKVATNNLS